MRSFVRRKQPPVKGLSFQRINRLRFSWYFLGLCSGILGAAAFSAIDTLVDDLTMQITDKDSTPKVKSSHSAANNISAPAKPEWPKDIKVTVRGGDHLLGILTNQGIPRDDAYAAIDNLKPSFNPRSLSVGQKLEMTVDKGRHGTILRQLSLNPSNIEQIHLNRMDDGTYRALTLRKPTTLKLDWAKKSIRGSMYTTAKRQGLPDKSIIELIRAYSYDVDFQRDIKQGDTFEVLYEKQVTNDGQMVSTGNVLFANLYTRGKSFKIYRFVDSSGIARYFNEKGENIVKQLLRTPLDGARISSGFGMRRHPVLGFSRMHKGIDFASPTGTPIFAAGDGVVAFAGRRGAYGNYVQIKHNPTYSTAYGHASRIAPGIRNGARVRQGQVIAYVGATGMATGAHLHYEIIKNGAQVNPSGVQFAGGTKLNGKDLTRFAAIKRDYEAKIAALQPAKPTQVASR